MSFDPDPTEYGPPALESSGQSGRYLQAYGTVTSIGQASIRKSQGHNEGTGEQASKGNDLQGWRHGVFGF